MLKELKTYVRAKEIEIEKVAKIRMHDGFKANTFSFRSDADVDLTQHNLTRMAKWRVA